MSPALTMIPLEFVERHVAGTGLAFMARAQLQGASFKSDCRLYVRQARFVADIDFEHPLPSGDGVTVMLDVMASRHRRLG